jgi:hypothetical protein
MVTSWALMILLIGGIAEVQEAGNLDAARRVVELQIGQNEHLTVDEPYYFFRMSPRSVVEHEADQYETILSYSDDRCWNFPVRKNGTLIQISSVSRKGDRYRLNGSRRPNEYTTAYLEYRHDLKKGYDLAELVISGIGHFWVIHKDLTAKEFVPVDNGALFTMTGRSYRDYRGLKNRRRYGVTQAVMSIRERIRENDERVGRLGGFEPVPEGEPANAVNDADIKLGKINIRVVDSHGRSVKSARVVVDGFDEGSTSTDGTFSVRRIAPGRHDMAVAKRGYDETQLKEIAIQPGLDTTLTVEIQRAKIEIDAEGNIIALPNDHYKAYPTRLKTPRGLPAITGDYRHCRPIIKELGLEFSACYHDSIVCDKAYVSVVATVHNSSSETISRCGSISFITHYRPLNYPMGSLGVGRYRIPKLRVTSEGFETSTIRCGIRDLRPGESASDSLQFQYRVSRFKTFYGELQAWILFNYGQQGEHWADSRIVDLGTLLIPIGQPSNQAPLPAALERTK